MNGNKVSGGTDYKWGSDNNQEMRDYLYYSTDTSERQYFVYPRIDVVDGSEPSISDLVNGLDSRTSNSNEISLTQEGALKGNVSEVGPAPESLVGWWEMQNSGGIVEDKSGEGNHTEIRGSPTFTGSAVGNTVDLVESNGDYLPIQNLFYDEVEQIPKITMAAWVKTTNDNDYIMQFDRSEFFRCTTGVWVTNSDASGGINDFNYSGASDGNWHHVVHWYDKDASGDKKRVYIDGDLQASTADPHNGTALGSGLDTYGAIGAFGESRSFNGDDSARMTGSMADVRLYETALTPEQIETLYKLTDPRSDQQVMQSDDGVVYTKGGVDERL
jgi:hypothetical protein